jgi:ketopantoate reductase
MELEERTRTQRFDRQPPVAVVGTGVIGTIYAALLREQGCAVTHLVRPGTAAARPSSVEVDWLDLRRGRKRHSHQIYEYTLAEALPPDVLFVLVPVRLYQLTDVLPVLAGMPPDLTAVIFTANWTGPGPLDQALIHGNYVLADASPPWSTTWRPSPISLSS